jgi:hypothetical protein
MHQPHTYNLKSPPVQLIIIILVFITLQTLTVEVYIYNIQTACREYIKTSSLFIHVFYLKQWFLKCAPQIPRIPQPVPRESIINFCNFYNFGYPSPKTTSIYVRIHGYSLKQKGVHKQNSLGNPVPKCSTKFSYTKGTKHILFWLILIPYNSSSIF